MNLPVFASVFLASVAPMSSAVAAYIGPGTGLSALGAVLALTIGLTVAFVAFVWYPIRRLRRKSRARGSASATAPDRALKP